MSKKITFTDTMIKNLKPESAKYSRAEGNGFAIRVMPSGVKTFLYIYTVGKRREMNLGSYPHVTLETARTAFQDAQRQVKNGIDPLAVEEAKQKARDEAYTFAKLCDEFLDKHSRVKNRPNTIIRNEEIIKRDLVPIWGKRKVEDITKRDVNLLLESIVDRGAPAMSNSVFRLIRKMFNFAIERDILPPFHSPCIGVKQHAKNTVRDRALDETEIKSLWSNFDNAAMRLNTIQALKLILITAQRPGEVAGMHTNEIDGTIWTIPAERSKNGKANRVYLTGMAQSIIDEAIVEINRLRKVPLESKYSGFIFPCREKLKVKCIRPIALARAVKRSLEWPLKDKKGKPLFGANGKPATENLVGIDCFTPHDLRRTAATFMSQSGILDEHIDAVLNHTKTGIIATYNKNKYDKEKQVALEAWERKLQSILTGSVSNVININQGRRKAA